MSEPEYRWEWLGYAATALSAVMGALVWPIVNRVTKRHREERDSYHKSMMARFDTLDSRFDRLESRLDDHLKFHSEVHR